MRKFEKGELVRCESAEELTGPVVGKVIQVLTSRVVIEVLNYHFRDRQMIADHNFRLAVCPTKFKTMKVVNYGF